MGMGGQTGESSFKAGIGSVGVLQRNRVREGAGVGCRDDGFGCAHDGGWMGRTQIERIRSSGYIIIAQYMAWW